MTAPMLGTFVNPGQHLQRLRRVSRIYTDQHGRRFYAQADATTNQPIGEFVCQDGQLPWQPPMRFIKWKSEGSLDFAWDYQSMADELIGLTASYYDEATKAAIDHNLPTPEMGGEIDRRLRAVFGPAPLSPEVPLQADAGEPWILGERVPVNVELRALIHQGLHSNTIEAMQAIKDRVAATLEKRVAQQSSVGSADEPAEQLSTGRSAYAEFVQEGKSRGMSLPDIAQAWAQHKQNILADQAA